MLSHSVTRWAVVIEKPGAEFFGWSRCMDDCCYPLATFEHQAAAEENAEIQRGAGMPCRVVRANVTYTELEPTKGQP